MSVSLKRNVAANYASQAFVTLVGIIVVPVYLRFMGAEAYGLVGFFVMLQAWFQLLDLGLTPTMTRETARLSAGATDALALRRLLRALEIIFAFIAVLGAGLLAANAGYVAARWLKVQTLPLAVVEQAIQLMAAVVALRWVCGLYRGAITGLEHLVWLSYFNSIAAATRFLLVIPLFIWVGASATLFFQYQLAVAGIELLVLVAYTYRALPTADFRAQRPWQWAALGATLRFSLGIALSGSIWVVVTQIDKLILSRLLPLADYAFFTLAVLVASSVTLITAPMSVALLPRLTRLAAGDDHNALLALYGNATQWVAMIAAPLALMLAVFAQPVLWAWTGDAAAATSAAPVLTLYALGNSVLAFSAFAYYLQYALGKLRLHIAGHLLFALLLVPALVGATLRWGMAGAGWAWLLANAAYFLLWVPLVHRHLAPGIHGGWLLRNLAPPVALGTFGALVAQQLFVAPQGRLATAAVLLVIGTMIFALSALGSSWVRERLRLQWRRGMARQG